MAKVWKKSHGAITFSLDPLLTPKKSEDERKTVD
jgi:hypothetical protein